MFYVAEALLIHEGCGAFKKHAAVHAAFGEKFSKTGKLDPKYHRWLLDAFDKRIIGDYGIETFLEVSDTEDLIEHAKEFLQKAQNYISI